jgi:hypothetical protein
MNWTEHRRQRLQARMDEVEAELAEDERIMDRRANLDSRRFLIYEERPAYAAPIRIMSAEEFARL